MSERISFTYEELEQLVFLITEAREGVDEQADDEEIAVRNRMHDKVRRAFTKARRKRP